MRMVPALNSTGTRLYVGTDHGRVYCLDTTVNPSQRVIWWWQMPGSTVYPIRSAIAYDPAAPKLGGGTEEAIYFQANDGHTYSLNAVTGAQRWSRNTGNLGGPPPAYPDHPIPWSCTPLVSLSGGSVFVGSADGHFYCLDAMTGLQGWRVKLNASNLPGDRGEPIEATPAISENNGLIYVATRTADVGGAAAWSHLYAIDPDADENAKIKWQVSLGDPLGVLPGWWLTKPARYMCLYFIPGFTSTMA